MIEVSLDFLKECESMSKKFEKIDAKDIGIFIKFVEKKYVSSTLKGNLFFTSPTYFSNHEARYKNEKMGDVNDPNEASDKYVMKTDEVFMRREGQKDIIRIPVKRMKINFKPVGSYGICSFMYLSLLDFEEDTSIDSKKKNDIKNNLHLENNLKIFRLKPEVVGQLKDFQEIEEDNKHDKCIPLLFSNNEFMKTISNPQNGMGYGLVEYHDFNKEVEINEVPDYSKESEVKILFKKDISYAGQREYRLIRNIQKNIKGEECSCPELNGHIFESSISDLEQRKLLIGYHGSDLFVKDK